MQARHRNGPGNRYRTHAMGTGGLAAASRISPEGTMRSHRMYNSEYRKYNRGSYGHSRQSKQLQPSLLSPRGTDIFMEAGRLAAEYLVSNGVLPPNALSGNWQNDGTPAYSHLDTGVVDVAPGRRRYSDVYNSIGWKNSMSGRRTGSFKDGLEWNQDFGRNVSLSDKSRTSPGTEADLDASGGHQGEQLLSKGGDSVVQNSSPGKETQESDSAANLESGLEFNSVDGAGAKVSLSINEKDLPSDAKVEPIKESYNASISSEEAEGNSERSNVHDLGQKYVENMDTAASAKEDSLVSEGNLDLTKHCKLERSATRTCSSLSIRGSQVDPESITEDENINESKISEVSEVDAVYVPFDGSTDNASSHRSSESKDLDFDVLKAPAAVEEWDVAFMTRPGQCSRSRSLPGRSAFEEQNLDEGLPGFRRSNSVFMERGEKRAMDDYVDGRKRSKKPREWAPQMESQSDGCFPFANAMENQHTSQEPKTPPTDHATSVPDQKSLDILLLPKGHTESCEYTAEKQLFPGSFKTCDLNLIETSDGNEKRHIDPIFTFLSITGTGKQATPIDIDLSTGNNCNESNKNGKHEVIDLENDSAPEDKTYTDPERNYTDPERRDATVLTGPVGFRDNVHNANEIPDVQDGYGLMISEFLGNNSPSCSSIPTDLNSLHSDMGLPNGEGILGDDDSIYMSLGEIPISFMRPWDQPTQDYGKPF